MEINIGIPVYNEENTLPKTINYLKKQLEVSDIKAKFFFCLNGCTDNSEEVVRNLDCEKEVLFSKNGKIKAHKRIVSRIKELNNRNFTVFMDADTYVPLYSIRRLIEELNNRRKLRIVSAYPVSIRPRNINLIEKFWYEVINIKRHYPKVEISKYDVSHIHDEDNEWLSQSRIYIHGRLFALKNVNDYHFPREDSEIIGDDTLLSRMIIHKYGKGSLKVLFDVNVKSQGLCNPKLYIKYWHRILADVEIIKKEYPEIGYLNTLSETKMNWNYIFLQSKNFNVMWKATFFWALKKFMILTFSLKKNNIDSKNLWTYKNKQLEDLIVDDN